MSSPTQGELLTSAVAEAFKSSSVVPQVDLTAAFLPSHYKAMAHCDTVHIRLYIISIMAALETPPKSESVC